MVCSKVKISYILNLIITIDVSEQPLAHRMKLKVLPNPLIGVKGNLEL
jgi:hypothetical protein